MSFPALSGAVARTARLVGSSSSSTATDGELLSSFVRTRGEVAFADLVRRLGSMVLGVCRRVAGDSHLAEDAFQATFVVLARRAADVRPAEAVRAWLYGVAVRTAREARAVSARRLAREIPVPTLPDRASKPVHEPDADALAILDEEVAALPDHLRVAVMSCEIDCLARKDAAKRLGISEGTLSSRLAKARKLLAARLRKRGVSLPIAGLAMLTHATVPSRLAAQTSALVSATAPLPPAVAALSNGVFRTMFFQKLTLAMAGGALLALAWVMASGLAWVSAQEPPKPLAVPASPVAANPTSAAAVAAPVPRVAAPVAYKDLMLVLVSKDGAAAVVFHDPEEDGVGISYKFRYESADGKTRKAGDGKVLERRLDKGIGGFDESLLDIKAGPIALRWSKGGKDRGWIYYAPEMLQVHIAHAKNFEDNVDPHSEAIGHKIENKALDLKRYMRK